MSFKQLTALTTALSILILSGLNTQTVQASSHREAPYISTDQQMDASDVYAFVSPDAPNTVTLIANYIPLQLPAAGPNFYKFAENALYEINIDNNGDALEDISFQFQFQTKVSDQPAGRLNGLNSFLYNNGAVNALTDGTLLQQQQYQLSVYEGQSFSKTRSGNEIAKELPVAPAYVGPKSFPNYAQVANQAIQTIKYKGYDIKAFVGPRDDPFFVSLGETFDLINYSLDAANPTAKDDVAGLNVHTIALQIPIELLTVSGEIPSNPTDASAVLGVRTTSYRKSRSVLRPGFGSKAVSDRIFSGAQLEAGSWVQVSRLDIPLINEVVIGLKDKDRFNGSRPAFDGQFADYVVNPVLVSAMNVVFGSVLTQAGLPKFPETGRADLVEILLKGVPGLNRPANVVPSSQLRLNVAIGPSATPSRMGVLAQDNAGFPNGRRLTDDVVDIEIQVVAGLLATAANGYTGTALPSGLTTLISGLGDGVSANDEPFLSSFPYLATPHAYR